MCVCVCVCSLIIYPWLSNQKVIRSACCSGIQSCLTFCDPWTAAHQASEQQADLSVSQSSLASAFWSLRYVYFLNHWAVITTKWPIEVEIQRPSTCWTLSGWFISLPQFLSHHNKDLERGTKEFTTTNKSQLSYSSSKQNFY